MEQKPRILIADDSEMNRAILADMLEDEYEIIKAEDGIQAVAALEQYGPTLSLLLLDIVMPNLDGFGVLTAMNQRGWINDIPVIMISSESRSAAIERAYELGISDFISRPFDISIVHHRVVNTILLYAKQRKLISLVEQQVRENTKQSGMMIDILSHIVEFRNGESGLHVLHIRTLTDLLLRYLTQKTDRYGLSEQDISRIATASALHDIGKIAIPSSILNKPGKLTDEEFAVMKTHSTMGAQMLEGLEFHKDEPLLKSAYEICRWHHERYDGRGYPDGLKGDDIPIGAQIVALADVYDALTSKRVYKPAFSHEKAVEMILNGECGAFNPLLLECLSEYSQDIRIAMTSDGASISEDPAVVKGITDEVLQREELSASEHALDLMDHERMKYSILAEISNESQFEYTRQPPILTFFGSGAERLGLPPVLEDPLHHPLLQGQLFSEAMAQLQTAVRSALPQRSEIDLVCRLPFGGEPRWVRFLCRVLWDADSAQFTGLIGKLVDINEEKCRMDELEQLASHDALTGLYNWDHAKAQIARTLRDDPGTDFALAILDLDNFKSANDTHGHQFGDRVLAEAAKRLRSILSGDAVVARMGGDEFLLFFPDDSSCQQTLTSAFDQLCQDYEGIKLSVSAGVARTREVQADYDALFHAADLALYAAKRAGRGQLRLYDDSIQDLFSSQEQ